jgi:hypothetical protein
MGNKLDKETIIDTISRIYKTITEEENDETTQMLCLKLWSVADMNHNGFIEVNEFKQYQKIIDVHKKDVDLDQDFIIFLEDLDNIIHKIMEKNTEGGKFMLIKNVKELKKKKISEKIK